MGCDYDVSGGIFVLETEDFLLDEPPLQTASIWGGCSETVSMDNVRRCKPQRISASAVSEVLLERFVVAQTRLQPRFGPQTIEMGT